MLHSTLYCFILQFFRNITLLNEDFLYSIIYARLAKNDTAPLFTLIHFVFHVYVAHAHQKCYVFKCSINIY